MRLTAIRGRSAVRGGTIGGCPVSKVVPDAGLRHRTGDQVAVLPQRDVHRPVVAGRLGELPGAVQRVDDPDPGGGEPVGVVDAGLALLRQHRVVGPVPAQQRHQQVVGGAVAGVLELPALEPLGRGPR